MDVNFLVMTDLLFWELGCFHNSGKELVRIDRLNHLVELGMILLTVPFSILAEISSGLVDFVRSSPTIISKTSSSGQSNALGESSGFV